MVNMIERYLSDIIKSKLHDEKAIIIFGARQVGKTTLLKSLFGREDTLWLNGDEEEVRATFDNLSASSLGAIIGQHQILIIDEAQRISNIGLKLKIIHDHYKDRLTLIATGSSSFELANQINEPLTGRKWEYKMYPLSFSELVTAYGLIEERGSLEKRLLYGCYPEIVTHPEDAEERLNQLAHDNLYKDILRLDGINKPSKLEKLLQALAFQIGSQVSINELSGTVGLDNKTVEKYLSLLEQSFIIFRLPSYARNLRNELSASSKYYFYDTGIRNAIIDDFRPINLRQDIGALFENFIIAELQKTPRRFKQFFWRTSQQQEIDYLTVANDAIEVTEIKWTEKPGLRLPKTFLDTYHPTEIHQVHQNNYADFLLKKQKILKNPILL